MLDVGVELEDERSRELKLLTNIDPGTWNRSPEARFLRAGIRADSKGIPLKPAYGSDFPYRTIPGATALACEGVHTQPSLARGGFSNVWGSAMLPYRQQDLEKWPITEKDLAPHYRAVLESVPLAGREDGLADLFPLYASPAPMPVSAQARALLDRLERNRAALAGQNIFAGASRLAVRNQPSLPCRACGLCMYGCPAGLIYSSAHSLDDLISNPAFSYSPGLHVSHVEERNGAAYARGFETRTGDKFEYGAARVFLACGAVGTTTILLRSLDVYSQPVTMLDSQYFLQPALTLNGARSVTKENLHTLAQAFLEVMDSAVSRFTVHFQIYTYNELYSQAIASTAGPLHRFVPKDMLLGRLALLQGYLHSDESPGMSCELERSAPGDTLHVRGNANPGTAAKMRKATNKLLQSSMSTGLIPLTPLLRPGQPGRGFHSGGSFPMSDRPTGFQSDTLGRPAGFLRIHAVDSTVFSSIPATTITFTAMANAHRIGMLAAEL